MDSIAIVRMEKALECFTIEKTVDSVGTGSIQRREDRIEEDVKKINVFILADLPSTRSELD